MQKLQIVTSYLLSYIFELARTANTQLICLTGHMQVDIYMQFDVMYSLLQSKTRTNDSVLNNLNNQKYKKINPQVQSWDFSY